MDRQLAKEIVCLPITISLVLLFLACELVRILVCVLRGRKIEPWNDNAM